jgi:hemerythrin superfamily protein
MFCAALRGFTARTTATTWEQPMARAKKKATRKTTSKSSTRTKRANAGARTRQQDAIALLKGDHREVEQLFEQFQSTRSDGRKQSLAQQVCRALKVHTQIEAEIFYPAFLEATEETDIHHEAQVEHDGAKKLIAEIEASGPEDDYFDAKVTVLSEMIKHHVNEEERRDGMFAKARSSKMDLQGLGERLAQRKSELMSDSGPREGTRRQPELQSRRRRGAAGMYVNA